MLKLKPFYFIIFFCSNFFSSWGQVNNCECVPFYLCSNGTIITDGVGIIDVRIGTSHKCSNSFEVCCVKSKKLVLLKNYLPDNPPSEKRGCGFRNPEGLGDEITGDDNEAHFGEFPWMVAIFYKGANLSKHFFKCGGSLIHPRVILTAAHCVANNGSYKIRAGEWDSKSSKEIYKHEDRAVAFLLMHPRFDKRNFQNDIALLFLETPIDLVAHINVVCLPSFGTNPYSDKCYVSGWGKQYFEDSDQHHVILKKVELSVVRRNECQNDLKKTRLGKKFSLHRSATCAGGEERKDSCKGDGGGPLVCPMMGEGGRYQQVGIVSWGIGCGTRNVPGVYADVAYLRYWIDQQLMQRNINISEYRH